MNFDKLFAFVSDQWARHSPTIAVHLALLLMLQLAVLQPGLLHAEPLWAWIKSGVDASLTEVGIKLERGYVLVALGYFYLAIAQSVAAGVARLPLLRLSYAEPPLEAGQLSYAGRVLHGPPDYFATRSQLRELVDQFVRASKAQGEPEPSQWLLRERSELHRYYGLCVLCALGSLGWLLAGAPGALTRERVDALLLFWVAAALLVRWLLRRNYVRREQQLRWAALNAQAKALGRQPELRGEPGSESLDERLAQLRARLVSRHMGFERARARSPAGIAERLSFRLPRPLRERVRPRLAWADRPGTEEDWAALSSALSRHADSPPPAQAALQPRAYEQRFAALLECPGAGLCLLIDPALGLAPAAEEHGASYCFATRRHGGRVLPLRWHPGWPDSEGARESGDFVAHGHDAQWGFVIDIGAQPIETLVQGKLPPPHWQAQAPLSRELDTRGWTQDSLRAGRALGDTGLSAQDRVPVQPGHSYLLRRRLRSGVEAVVAFQCFAVPEPGRLLLAWKILSVLEERRSDALAPPWWRLQGWRGMLRQPDR